jgi:hypothetical protein
LLKNECFGEECVGTCGRIGRWAEKNVSLPGLVVSCVSTKVAHNNAHKQRSIEIKLPSWKFGGRGKSREETKSTRKTKEESGRDVCFLFVVVFFDVVVFFNVVALFVVVVVVFVVFLVVFLVVIVVVFVVFFLRCFVGCGVET